MGTFKFYKMRCRYIQVNFIRQRLAVIAIHNVKGVKTLHRATCRGGNDKQYGSEKKAAGLSDAERKSLHYMLYQLPICYWLQSFFQSHLSDIAGLHTTVF